MKASKWNTFRADCVQFLLERMDWWRPTNLNGMPITIVPKEVLDRKLITNFPNSSAFDVYRRYIHTYLGVPFWATHAVSIKLVGPQEVEVLKLITFSKISNENATPVASQIKKFSLDDFHGRTRKIVSEWRDGWFEEIEHFLDDPYACAVDIAPWAKTNLVSQTKEN